MFPRFVVSLTIIICVIHVHNNKNSIRDSVRHHEGYIKGMKKCKDKESFGADNVSHVTEQEK